MTTTARQTAALARLMETEGDVKRTAVLASGALVVYFQDGSTVVIERNGKVY